MNAANSDQRRLLIVDDIAENRNLLSRFFGARGYQVAQAGCGVTALSMIKQQQFDAVLLDIVMPEIDGIEVLKAIRAIYSQGELPVIMVSGQSGGRDISLALDLGANDYITKPVDLVGAFAKLQRALSPVRPKPAHPQVTETAGTEKAVDLSPEAERLLNLATKFRREGNYAYAEQLTARAAQFLE
jgi:CheY-like chemotaxis protein